MTNDLERRIHEHTAGSYPGSYTYSKRPVQLVFYEEFDNPEGAFEYEKKIKRWSRKKKQALIDGNWDQLKELSACKNKTSHRYYRETR
jgi:putative endonuclease